MLINYMETYINKLIENIPNQSYGNINLILDGGAFSGSYILGGLLYLKQMELRNKIKIDKLSGTSIGSILCVLYKMNNLEYASNVYSNIRDYYKENGNLHILSDTMNNIRKRMKPTFYKKCNYKVYITYYDISKNMHVIKKKYYNNKDLCDSIIKSCYIPYICGENFYYKGKYIDGLQPYLFEDKRSLFMNLSMDYKIMYGILNIKNEVNNIERVMNGILNIHNFFSNKKSTNMCFYVDKMSYIQKILHSIRVFIIYLIISGFSFIYYVHKTFNMDNVLEKMETYICFIKPQIYNYLKLYHV